MHVTTVSDFRDNIKHFMDAACDDAMPVVVARPKGRNVVVLSEQEFNSWRETMHLLSNEANRKALQESIQQASEGKLIHKTMEELLAFE